VYLRAAAPRGSGGEERFAKVDQAGRFADGGVHGRDVSRRDRRRPQQEPQIAKTWHKFSRDISAGRREDDKIEQKIEGKIEKKGD